MWNHEIVQGLYIFFTALCFILKYYIILNFCSKFEWSTCHMIFFTMKENIFWKLPQTFFKTSKLREVSVFSSDISKIIHITVNQSLWDIFISFLSVRSPWTKKVVFLFSYFCNHYYLNILVKFKTKCYTYCKILLSYDMLILPNSLNSTDSNKM